jgi:hypothetical protein
MATHHTQVDGNDLRLPDGVVADILAADRRRLALEHLAAADEQVVVGDLAATIAASEQGIEPDAVEEATREAVHDDLYQRHLPKLTATEAVTYNSMLGTVAISPLGERVLAAAEGRTKER